MSVKMVVMVEEDDTRCGELGVLVLRIVGHGRDTVYMSLHACMVHCAKTLRNFRPGLALLR